MKKTGLLIAGILFFGICGLAWADATIESTMKSGGFKGMGAFEGTATKRYQGKKMWDSTSTKFTGAILSRIAGGSDTAVITRVDRGLYWELDQKNKTYTETPIEALKKDDLKKQEKETPKVRVTKSEFSVKKSGASETINGFPCEEYLIAWILELEDLETKAKSRSTMKSNLWNTAETATIRKVVAEENAFNKAYVQKLGIRISPQEAKQMGIDAFASMSGASQKEIEKGFAKLQNEMSKIKGYPIRTVVNWSVQGDQSAAAQSKGESESGKSSAETPASVGGFLTGLSKGLAQKVVKDKGSASDQTGGGSFSITTEVKAVSADSVPAALFEIPSGYSKK